MAKKRMTIEDLALMVKQGFDETAAKEDIKRVEGDMRQMEERLTRRIEGVEMKISSYASMWSRDFDRIHASMTG